MDRTVEDNTWYIAIMKMAGNRFETLVASGSSYYRNFSHRAPKYGVEIVAEQFDISDADINRIEGFNESGRKVRDSGLRILVYKLNAGEQIDVQEQLAKLATAA